MLKKDKYSSIEYWNASARDWKNRAYGADGNMTLFPTTAIRTEVVVRELIKDSRKHTKILDIGCADGRLVRDLVGEGFTNIKGIDNASEMIREAKELLESDATGVDSDEIFFVRDADELNLDEKFDYIICMGLVEYLVDIGEFFDKIESLLLPKGVAFIESRNRLFNLVTANQYTVDTEDIEGLIEELDSIGHLSPKQNIKDVVLDTYKDIGSMLGVSEFKTNKKPLDYEDYPFSLPQYSPLELVRFAEASNLNVEEIIYYHSHAFAPRFGASFPELYNKLGVLMQPLGYTPMGALMCSSFIAKVYK